jgi:hypothetical protein
VVINFLCVNSGNYSFTVCFSRIAIAITASRKLMRMGKKICFFVYYAKLISAELQMAVEGAALKGGLEPWMVEDRIKRGILKHCGSLVLLAKLVPVYSGCFLSCCICFCCASAYTIASNVS